MPHFADRHHLHDISLARARFANAREGEAALRLCSQGCPLASGAKAGDKAFVAAGAARRTCGTRDGNTAVKTAKRGVA